MGTRALRVASCCIVLSACSGGGGKGGSAPSYDVTLDRTRVDLEADYRGQLPAGQTVNATFVGDGLLVGYPPGAPPATSWLNVYAPSTVPANVVPVLLGVSTTDLVPGTYSTTLRFVTGKADGSAIVYKDLPVSYTVYDRPTLASAELSFRTVAGAADAPAAQALQFTFGSATTGWQVDVDQPWVSVDAAQGQGSGSVVVTVDPTALDAGTYAANLSVRAANGRQSGAAVVRLDCRPRRIWASRNGVALASAPGVDALSKRVVLYDNAGGAGSTWSASSDSAWLAATLSGPNELTLVADPTGLPPGMSFAAVSVGSSAAKVENAETIRVGLWKGANAPIEGALVDLAPVWNVYGAVATAVDPVRPWVYAVATDGSTVRAVNVYTGAIEATFPSVPGETFGSIVASSDGRWLFANSSATTTLFRLDVESGAWNSGFSYASQIIGAVDLSYLRPDGRPIVARGTTFLDARTGAQITTNLGDSEGFLFVTEDQLHVIGRGRYDLDFDAAANVLTASHLRGIPFTQSGTNVACNRDGTRVYTGGNLDYGYGFTSYVFTPDAGYALDQTITCAAYPTSVAVGDGGVFYAGRDAYYDPDTVSAYAPDGTPLHTYSIGTDKELLRGAKGMLLSGDGQRLLLVSTEAVHGRKTSLWGFAAQP